MGILSWTESYGDETFMNFNMSKLRRDQAYLNISNTSPDELYLYSVYKECLNCPFTEERNITGSNMILKIDTLHPKLWRILTQNPPTSSLNSNDNFIRCNLDPNFGEFGVYNLKISKTSECRVDTLKEPVNIYFPILTVILIYVFLAIFVSSFLHVWKVYTKKTERPTTSYVVKELEQNQQRRRLKSLDTFRGISIVLMIFVNYGCGGYRIFDHAIWNGLQLADVVFPWFMWIMGVCIPISAASIRKKGIPKKTALKSILKRSCILFGLGLFLGAGKNLDRLRIFGVLQRFGVCYFVVASIFILLPSKQQVLEGKKKRLNHWADILALKYQWLCASAFLLVHVLLTFFLPVPHCVKGYLGPGGYHEQGRHFGCTGGATGYIDKIILGNHRYLWPTILEIYKSEPFDPEGIAGCLTSIFQVFIGSQAGMIVLVHKGHASRLLRWLIWGIILGLVGGALCGFSQEGGLVPVNKNLWSISFVLVTSSLAFLLLALCYFLVDVKMCWSGNPFIFAGMNAIFMYVGHSMTYNNFPIRWIPHHDIGLSTHFVSLLENIWATGMWVVIAYYLFRIKFFLSI